ncbi:MAG: hypothetical protein ACTSQO_14790 [Candidatus Helarchaeota archaeon]
MNLSYKEKPEVNLEKIRRIIFNLINFNVFQVNLVSDKLAIRMVSEGRGH